jgi:hypothetical protein
LARIVASFYERQINASHIICFNNFSSSPLCAFNYFFVAKNIFVAAFAEG